MIKERKLIFRSNKTYALIQQVYMINEVYFIEGYY